MRAQLKEFCKKGIFIFVLTSVALLPIGVLAKGKEMNPLQKTMALNKPGVVFISTYYNMDLIIQSSAGIPQLSGKNYKAETEGMGSGFVVSPDGYILTNGHVVKTPDKLLAIYAIMAAADQILKDVVIAVVQAIYGYTPTDAEIEQLMPSVLAEMGGREGVINELYSSYQAGELKLDNIERNVYVQQGAFVSGKKIPIEKGMKADVREVDFEGFSDSGEAKGKDIAILKVAGSNMPTVKVADSSSVQVGDKVYIMGYPGAPTFQEFLSKESQLESTVTAGIISALKTMQDGSQVFQTDAALTHGNSGGPAFNEDGEVIGIASMVAIEAGQQKYGFSYLRPSSVAKEFMQEKNVKNEQGLTDKHYRKGIDYYEKGKYQKAIKEFESALKLYPALTDAQEYITKCQEGISSQSIFEKALGYVEAYWWIALVVVVVGAGAVVLVLIIRRKKKTTAPVAGAASAKEVPVKETPAKKEQK